MSKKFYIGICCLALLATSVASGYTEDFEGYTGNVGDPLGGDPWDGTPEFNASGWGTMYSGTNPGDPTSPLDLATGYNSAQGVIATTYASAARLLPDPQGANGTFEYTVMTDLTGCSGNFMLGTDELVAPQLTNDGSFTIMYWGDNARLSISINGTGYHTGWEYAGIYTSRTGWMETKIEVDTNASSRPTVLRHYWRDLEDDGSGPVAPGTWTQKDWGGTGGGYDLNMDGPDYKIEAIGFRGERFGARFDNLVATVDVPWVELPGDVDGDGFIDNDDLDIILGNWGRSGMGREGGDLNDNGVVDGPDYAEVLSYWAPAEPPEAAGVPEPLTLAILGIGSLLALIGRRRR